MKRWAPGPGRFHGTLISLNLIAFK